MADKGFDIEKDLPNGVALNIPPFLHDKEHFSIEEEIETRRIASLRIHVEWAIARIKSFRILSTVFPISMAANLNKIWVICCYLTNLLPPLLVERETWLTLCTQVKFVRFWRTQHHTIESTYVIFFNEHVSMHDWLCFIYNNVKNSNAFIGREPWSIRGQTHRITSHVT